MAERRVLPSKASIETHQFPLYHKYIQEGKENSLERESGSYGSVTTEQANIFRSQALRISSFESELSSFSKYSVLQLAQDGFFNTQRGKEIKCFSCGLLFHLDLDPGDPLEIHQQNNRCKHIRGVDRSNVAFGIIVQPGEITNTRTKRSTSDLDRADQSEAPNRNVHRQVVITDFRLELCRLQSFKNWPSNAAVKPDDLANAGFLYKGTDDRVQCTFCHGILRSWEPKDRALGEHLRHFPQCPFLIDPQSVGNVPLGEEDESVFSSIQLREGIGAERDSVSSQRREELQPLRPFSRGRRGTRSATQASPMPSRKQKNYAQPPERFNSFSDFPFNAIQEAGELARAGFYYTGQTDKSDMVQCYCCNVAIKNWKPTDDPWVEHVKASGSCRYVRMMKGEKFVEDILKNNRQSTGNAQKKRKHLNDPSLRSVTSSREVRQPPVSGAVPLIVNSPVSSEGIAYTPADIENMEELRAMNAQLKQEQQCKVCLDSPACIVFLKCGHLVCCDTCWRRLYYCPVCRQDIDGAVKANL